jgi:hypothetical protein
MIVGYKKLGRKQAEALKESYLENRALNRSRSRWFWFSETKSTRLPPVSFVRFVWNEFLDKDTIQTTADKGGALAHACKQLGYCNKVLKREFTKYELEGGNGKSLLENLPENQKALSAIINIVFK